MHGNKAKGKTFACKGMTKTSDPNPYAFHVVEALQLQTVSII